MFLRLFQSIPEWIFFFLIIAAPLAFGSNTPSGVFMVEAASLCIASIWLITSLLQGHFPIKRRPEYILILMFLTYVLLQIIPLSPGTLKHVSPGTYDLYRETLPRSWDVGGSSEVQQGEQTRGEEEMVRKRTLSIYPFATRYEIELVLSYFLIYLTVSHLFLRRDQIRRAARVIISLGLGLAVFGIVQKLTWNGKIYWVRELTQYSDVFGPFVSKNHYAGFQNMTALLGMGYLYGMIHSWKVPEGKRGGRYVAALLSQERSVYLIFMIFAVALMTITIFLSLSRGGVVSFFFGLISFVILTYLPQKKQGERRGFKVWVLVAILSVALVFWIRSVDPMIKRLSTLRNPFTADETRWQVGGDTLVMAKDFPLFGIGLGAYQHLYPKYKTLPVQAIYDHAHNDYLELLSEVGIVGFLLVSASVALVLIGTMKRLKERRDPSVVGLAAGMLSGTIAIFFHGFGDFNLQIPSNALLCFVLLALAGCVVRSRPASNGVTEGTDDRRLSAPKPIKSLACLFIAAVALFILTDAFRSYRAERSFIGTKKRMEASFSKHNSLFPSMEEGQREMERLRKGAEAAPLYSKNHSLLAGGYANLGLLSAEDRDQRMELFRKARAEYERAVSAEPTNADYHMLLGWVMSLMGESRERIEEELRIAVELNPTNLRLGDLVRGISSSLPQE